MDVPAFCVIRDTVEPLAAMDVSPWIGEEPIEVALISRDGRRFECGRVAVASLGSAFAPEDTRKRRADLVFTQHRRMASRAARTNTCRPVAASPAALAANGTVRNMTIAALAASSAAFASVVFCMFRSPLDGSTPVYMRSGTGLKNWT
jgi:hypothetical protein